MMAIVMLVNASKLCRTFFALELKELSVEVEIQMCVQKRKARGFASGLADILS